MAASVLKAQDIADHVVPLISRDPEAVKFLRHGHPAGGENTTYPLWCHQPHGWLENPFLMEGFLLGK